jgi:hypothetical protein
MTFELGDLDILPTEICEHLFSFWDLSSLLRLHPTTRAYVFRRLAIAEKKCGIALTDNLVRVTPKNLITYKKIYQADPSIYPLFIYKYNLNPKVAWCASGNLYMFQKLVRSNHYHDYYSYTLHCENKDIIQCIMRQIPVNTIYKNLKYLNYASPEFLKFFEGIILSELSEREMRMLRIRVVSNANVNIPLSVLTIILSRLPYY